MRAEDNPAEAVHATSRTDDVHLPRKNRLSRAVGFVVEVIARSWPISRSHEEILTQYRRR